MISLCGADHLKPFYSGAVHETIHVLEGDQREGFVFTAASELEFQVCCFGMHFLPLRRGSSFCDFSFPLP